MERLRGGRPAKAGEVRIQREGLTELLSQWFPSARDLSKRDLSQVDGMKVRSPAMRNAIEKCAVWAAPRTARTSIGTMLRGRIPITVAR